MLELDSDDGVGTGRSLVHKSRAYGPVFIAFVHFLLNHLVRVDWVLRKALNIDSSGRGLSYLETACWFLAWISDKQVLHSLVVDLKHRELNLELPILILVSLDSSEDLAA